VLGSVSRFCSETGFLYIKTEIFYVESALSVIFSQQICYIIDNVVDVRIYISDDAVNESFKKMSHEKNNNTILFS